VSLKAMLAFYCLEDKQETVIAAQSLSVTQTIPLITTAAVTSRSQQVSKNRHFTRFRKQHRRWDKMCRSAVFSILVNESIAAISVTAFPPVRTMTKP